MNNQSDLPNIQLPEFKNLAPLKYVVLIVALFALISSAFVIVEAGSVGVVKTLGAVNDVPLKEGVHLKKPFIDTVIQVNIRLNNTKSSAALSSSKDLQTVKTEVSVQYSLKGDVAPKTYQKNWVNWTD